MSAGRKRKIGEREPSGRLRRATKIEARKLERAIDAVSPTEVARLRDAALAGMRASVWATVLGQLFARKILTPPLFEAGKRWSNLHRLYLRAIDCKTTVTAYLPVASGTEPEPPKTEREEKRPDEEEDEETRDNRHIKAYEAALAVLRSLGSSVERNTRALCEGNGLDPPGLNAFMDAMKGLVGLAAHWKL